MARVVVAGSSGNVGSAAVRKLSQMGVEVKALTRSSAAEKCAPLKALEHVQLVDCDISDPSSLTGVFDGVQAALLTCGNFQGQAAAEKSFIDAAVAAGCPYLVKLGTVRCYTSMDSAAEYARYHAEIESHLEKVRVGVGVGVRVRVRVRVRARVRVSSGYLTLVDGGSGYLTLP